MEAESFKKQVTIRITEHLLLYFHGKQSKKVIVEIKPFCN